MAFGLAVRLAAEYNDSSKPGVSMTQSSIDKPVWTYADYCVLPQDFNRHEIIEGDHVVTPSPTTKHQHVLANSHRYWSST